MPVNYCVCHKITFEEIKETAAQENLSTIEELRAEDICSTGCKLCEPYIKAMLETGQTSFEPGRVPNSGLNI